MKSILQITDKPEDGGGIRRIVESHATLLDARGYRFPILRLRHRGDDAGSDAFETDVTVISRLPEHAPCLVTLGAAAQDADLVHLHLGFTAVAPDFITAAARMAPLLVNLHDISPFLDLPLTGMARPRDPDRDALRDMAARWLRAPLRRTVWRRICSEAALILAPSRYILDLARAAGAPNEKLRLLPHPMPTDLPDIAHTPSNSPPHVVFAGLLSRAKGGPVLIEAFAEVRAADARLRVFGTGPEERTMRERAKVLGVEDRVDFLGRATRGEVLNAIAAARVVAHPSLVAEGFGLVGIEALSLERPVVGFGLGGSADWLSDGATGLVARAGNHSDLARCLDRLLMEPDIADRLGTEGGARARTRFCRSRIAQELIAAYSDAMSYKS